MYDKQKLQEYIDESLFQYMASEVRYLWEEYKDYCKDHYGSSTLVDIEEVKEIIGIMTTVLKAVFMQKLESSITESRGVYNILLTCRGVKLAELKVKRAEIKDAE